jgi:flagellar biogenesis protein FliO
VIRKADFIRNADVTQNAKRAGALMHRASVRPARIGGNVVVFLLLVLIFTPTHVYADAAVDPEQQTIARTSDSGTSESPATQQGAGQQSATQGNSGYDPLRVTLALGGVIGLIFALRWGAKWFYPGVAPLKGTASVRVLSRTVIGPRQQVVLIKVGRRILAVGDSGARLSPLCEITDPDEVASLLGAARSATTDRANADVELETPAVQDSDRPAPARRGNRTFAPMMDSASNAYDAEGNAGTDEIATDDAGAPDDETSAAPTDVDPAIAATQQQLDGLSQRVRLLAKQFAQP